jgi:hypothetical protein
MSQNKPKPPLQPLNEGSVPRSSINIPMPSGAKPPPPPIVAKPDADQRKKG